MKTVNLPIHETLSNGGQSLFNGADAKTSDWDTIEKVYEACYRSELYAHFPATKEISLQLGIKVQRFQSIFKKKYGKSLKNLLLENRMQYAIELLQRGYRCQEVSRMVGYGEISAIKFNKMFQKHFGITPKKYQMAKLNQNITSEK
ncbi:MAG: helix-turn-helix domain-containing protein [Runella sp.]